MINAYDEFVAGNAYMYINRLRGKLDDKGYHKIFEALFRFISVEKSAYTRTNRTASKTLSTTRLATCAAVIRTTAEVSVREIRPKTVTAVLYHITDVLPIPGEGLWEPLSSDYIKTLKTVLQYPAHVEHLASDDWHYMLEYCLRGISVVKENNQNQLSIRSGRRLPSAGLGESSNAAALETSQRGRNLNLDSKGVAEELELCIQLLTSCPSSPVLEEAHNLLHGITGYLSSLNTVGRSPHAAFSALNIVLSKAIPDNVGLVQDIIIDIIPTIRRFWATKSTALREEMLITLITGKDVLIRMGQLAPSESFIDSIQDLVDQLHRGYTRLSEKEVLHIDDLTFSPSVTSQMGVRFMAPCSGVGKSVQNWTILSVIASLSIVLDNAHSNQKGDVEFGGTPNKKQHLLSRVDDMFREASNSIGMGRVCALQLIPFILSESEPEAETLSCLLKQLTPNLLDDNNMVASWTMVAIAKLVNSSLCPLNSNNTYTV